MGDFSFSNCGLDLGPNLCGDKVKRDNLPVTCSTKKTLTISLNCCTIVLVHDKMATVSLSLSVFFSVLHYFVAVNWRQLKLLQVLSAVIGASVSAGCSAKFAQWCACSTHSHKQLPFLMNVHFETMCNDGSSRSSAVCDNNCACAPDTSERRKQKNKGLAFLQVFCRLLLVL